MLLEASGTLPPESIETPLRSRQRGHTEHV
jgi:hypothetical protein